MKNFTLNSLVTGIICSLIGATLSPASAQSFPIINNSGTIHQQPAVGSFIYGSPISTPMPVNPNTGLMPTRSDRHYQSYPIFKPNVGRNSGVNNPLIRNSHLFNPVLNNYSRPRQPLRRPGQGRIMYSRQRIPATGGSVIFFYSR
ncbi:hypothetical protein [Nodularia chucula]|uniref:hypothetical protein n=1 Tax=Nodularia chucula TaxID=3093667 RepID=UPI0039C67B43